MDSEQFLTVTEAARLLRVHPETLREWLRAGELRGLRLGHGRGVWRVPSAELERLQAREPAPTRRPD